MGHKVPLRTDVPPHPSTYQMYISLHFIALTCGFKQTRHWPRNDVRDACFQPGSPVCADLRTMTSAPPIHARSRMGRYCSHEPGARSTSGLTDSEHLGRSLLPIRVDRPGEFTHDLEGAAIQLFTSRST